MLLASTAYAWIFGPAYVAYWNYSPQEGDILFQSLPRTRLVNLIEAVTRSPYSHCGIVARESGEWIVYEAYRDVEATPLSEFIFRGRNQGFAVYRFTSEHQHHIASTIANTKKFVGRPYDARYRMDDDHIYCSELIYKAYLQTTGESLGQLVKMKELNWRPYQESIRYFEGGPVPLDREMITPIHLSQASQLQLVTAFQFRTSSD